MKNFIEVTTNNKKEKVLLNIGQIAAIQSIEHISNGCHIITSIKMEDENKTYYANCSYEEVKQLIEAAI
jgi:hypothetical protein